jgi:hypothetical protein
LGSLCGGAGHVLGGDGLDDTDGHGLSHVTDGEAAERGEVREGLHTHGLGGDQVDDGGISRLDGLGVIFGGLAWNEKLNIFGILQEPRLKIFYEILFLPVRRSTFSLISANLQAMWAV